MFRVTLALDLGAAGSLEQGTTCSAVLPLLRVARA